MTHFTRTTRRVAMGAIALAAATLSLGAAAQAYPTKPITVIVPFAAGGPTDVIARIVGEHMSKTLGQQIVVENVAGVGGLLCLKCRMRRWRVLSDLRGAHM